MSNILVYMLAGVGAALASSSDDNGGRRTIGAVMLSVGLNHILLGNRKEGV